MTFTLDQYTNGRTWKCTVKDQYGNSVDTNTVVSKVQSGSVAITKQPQDVTGSIGSGQKLTVSASGDGLTYQWYYLNNGTKTWVKTGCTGNTTGTLTFTLDQYTNGRIWKCIIKDKNGVSADTNTVTSAIK